jgi:hypothetical protein
MARKNFSGSEHMMTIAEVVSDTRQLFLNNPDRLTNWGTAEKPEYSPFSYVDAADEYVRDLNIKKLKEAIVDLLENHSELELDNYHTHDIGCRTSDTKYIDVLQTLLAVLVAQLLSTDEYVRQETKRRRSLEA